MRLKIEKRVIDRHKILNNPDEWRILPLLFSPSVDPECFNLFLNLLLRTEPVRYTFLTI